MWAVGWGSVTRGEPHINRFPPLTHVTRHFLVSWLALPAIYAVAASVLITWSLQPDRRPVVAAAVVAGGLGWLTEHFLGTYARHTQPPDEGEIVGADA